MIAKVSAMIVAWAAILVDFSGFLPGTSNSDSVMLALRIYLPWLCSPLCSSLILTYTTSTKEKHRELRIELENQ